MPRFMGFVRMAEGIGAPPQELFDAMDGYIGEQSQQGHFLDGGGLFGTEDAVNFVVRKGDTTRVDGPYAEAKEVVGGWALLQYDSLEAAIAGQQEFADLHAKHWPECEMVATLRQISEAPPETQPAPERSPRHGRAAGPRLAAWLGPPARRSPPPGVPSPHGWSAR